MTVNQRVPRSSRGGGADKLDKGFQGIGTLSYFYLSYTFLTHFSFYNTDLKYRQNDPSLINKNHHGKSRQIK